MSSQSVTPPTPTPAPTTSSSTSTSSSSGSGSSTSSSRGVQLSRALGAEGYEAQAAALAPVQAKGDAVHAAAAEGIQSGGGALPHGDAIQKSFGRHDVSGIQAHQGPAAQKASQAMGAQAYATGNHVAFGASPDLHTAAHEAAHVVQQRGGVQLSGGVGESGDRYERHADAVADAVVQGRSAEGLLDTMAPAQGQRGHVTQRRAIQREVGPTPESASGGAAPIRPHMGAVAPMGDQSALMFVQLDTGTPTTEDTPSPTTEGPTETRYRWVSKTVEGAAVHYLVEDPEGDVPLGPVQRTPVAENVAIETKIRAFELTIGQLATTHPAATGAAQAMASRVVEIVNAYLEAVYAAKGKAEEVDTKYGELLGGTDPIWAGTIGDDRAIIEAAATGGSLREQLSIANNFISSFGREYVEGAKTTEMSGFLTQIEGEKETLTERLAAMSATDNRLVPNDSPAISNQIAQQGQMRQGVPQGTSTQTEKTVGTLRNELRMEHPLTQNELASMGLTSEQGVSEEELANKRLTWNEGMRAFTIKEHDEFVQKLRQAAVPLGAGTSGTTARIMATGQMLGVTDAISLRAACIGYLIPIRAHTLWEVLQGAVAGGAPAPAPNLSAFKEIEPFGAGRSVYPDDEFWTIVDDTVRKVGG